MAFNSVQFLIFFTVTAFFYYSIPHHKRNLLLLGASYIFYLTSTPGFLGLIIVTTLMNFFVGVMIGKTDKDNFRKTYFISSLLINIGILLFFKYFNFFNENLRSIFDALNVPYGVPDLYLLIPLGISFYTFQILSYLIDVYRRARPPEHDMLTFALFCCFFPVIVSGPIERSTHLIPQFYRARPFDYQKVREGCLRVLWGLFKKMVIADRLGILVNDVYQDPAGYPGLPLIVATIFFAFQIYCDFSGYTDIALGVGRILGFDLTENFKQPYLARSITEFWKRWHITLTSWLRDYIYFPLTRKRIRRQGNTIWVRITDYYILLVFLISGFWHGASWSFIVWGGLHGFFLLMAVWWDELKKKYPHLSLGGSNYIKNFLNIVLTFSLVSFTWVFFRADSLTQAFQIIDQMFIQSSLFPTSYSMHEIAFLVPAIIFIMFIEWINSIKPVGYFLSNKPVLVRWVCYIGLILIILNFSVSIKVPFIYVQF